MKKFISILIASFLCLSLTFGAFASEFVPSITYKDGPSLLSAKLNGDDVMRCMVVTTIKAAQEKSTDISDEERENLLDTYEKLVSGEIKLPLENKYMIRELVDLSFLYEGCRCDESHGEKHGVLSQDGVSLTASFDLGMAQDENLKVLVCVNGEWKPVKSTVINTDGSVTVEFEDICPVAFCIESEAAAEKPEADNNIATIITWITVIAASLAAIIFLALKFLRPVK